MKMTFNENLATHSRYCTQEDNRNSHDLDMFKDLIDMRSYTIYQS